MRLSVDFGRACSLHIIFVRESGVRNKGTELLHIGYRSLKVKGVYKSVSFNPGAEARKKDVNEYNIELPSSNDHGNVRE
jgi:hypothetical protein